MCENWEGYSEGDLGEWQMEVVTAILEALPAIERRRTRKLVSS